MGKVIAVVVAMAVAGVLSAFYAINECASGTGVIVNAMARYKRILGDPLRPRTLPGQQTEATIGVTILNRMIDQARPNSVRIA